MIGTNKVLSEDDSCTEVGDKVGVDGSPVGESEVTGKKVSGALKEEGISVGKVEDIKEDSGVVAEVGGRISEGEKENTRIG